MTRRPFDGWQTCLSDPGQEIAGVPMRDLMATAVRLGCAAHGLYLDMLVGRGAELDTTFKADGSAVTALDTGISEATCAELRRAFPHHGVLSEEEPFEGRLDGPLWILDPVDGTSNLIQGLDATAFALAFAMDGIVRLAVVSAPLRGRTYWAVRGDGAYADGERLALEDDGRPARQAMLRTGFPHARTSESAERLGRRMGRMTLAFGSVRVTGCPVLDLCELAEGKVDLQSETVRTWDIAAAGLIAQEAGATLAHAPRAAPRDLPPELDGEDVIVGLPRLVEELRAVYAEEVERDAAAITP